MMKSILIIFYRCNITVCNMLNCRDIEINFIVLKCELPLKTYLFNINTKSQSHYLYVVLENDKGSKKYLKMNNFVEYSKLSYKLCLEESNYILRLKNTSSDAWFEGSNVQVKLNQLTLLNTQTSNLSPIFYLSTQQYFPNPIIYKYETIFKRDWYSPVFDDSSWKETEPYSLPNITGNDIYLRFHMNANTDFLNTLQFHILLSKLNYDVELYIQGRFLVNHIYSNSDTSVNNDYFIFSSLVKKYFDIGINVIAIHLKLTEPIGNYFESLCYVSPSGSIYTTTRTIFQMLEYPSMYTTLYNMVDSDITSSFIQIINYDQLNISILINQDYWTEASINAYFIRIGFEGREMDPRSWTLLGEKNGENYVIDKKVDQVFEKNEAKTYLFPDGTDLYSSFTLLIEDIGVVSSNNRSNRFHVSEFGLVMQQYEYCKSLLDFPDTINSHGRVIGCGPGYEGYRKRNCNDDSTWDRYPSFHDYCFIAPPQNLVYLFNKTLLYHLDIEVLGGITPRVGGASLTFTIFPCIFY